jgi:hypothetical protein
MVDIGFSGPLKWKPEPIRRLSSGIRRHRTDRSAGPAARTTRRGEGARIHQNLRSRSPEQSRKGPCLLVLVKQFMVLNAARLRSALVGIFERDGVNTVYRICSLPRRLNAPYRTVSWQRRSPRPGSAHGLSPSRGVARSRTGRSHGGPMGSARSFVDVIRFSKSRASVCALAPGATARPPERSSICCVSAGRSKRRRRIGFGGHGIYFIGLRVPNGLEAAAN